MAELATVARPYAEAAFKLAIEQNSLPVWGEMLKFSAAVMADLGFRFSETSARLILRMRGVNPRAPSALPPQKDPNGLCPMVAMALDPSEP